MKMPIVTTKQLTVIAMIAAIYTVLVVGTVWWSFGPVQIRIAEALTILAVLTPWAIWGIGLGCFVANFVGWVTGTNPLGWVDTIVGTTASVLAGIVSWKLRDIRTANLPLLSAFSPVIFNAVFIGGQLSIVLTGSLAAFPIFAAQVGAGQVVACMVLGLPLMKAVERTGLLYTV